MGIVQLRPCGRSFWEESKMKAFRHGGVTKRGRFLAWPLLMVACCALFFVAGAQAVHDDGVFELDGDAISASSAEDWNKICPAAHAAGAAQCLGGTFATQSFFGDDDSRIYTGGSTKDDLDITGWNHTIGSVPDKDDLLHGFAARYGDHLYFGADRFANNGDSQVGVWFLQDAVAPRTTGADAGTFSGAHQDGDVLVLSDFTKGGEVSTVRVFRWNGPGGSIAGQGAIDGTLDIIGGQFINPAPADWVGPPQVAAGDAFCATVNKGGQPSPWAFQPKSGSAGVFQKGELYEGGIDLSALHLDSECFSSVILETRSSQSTDAVLKDFVAGSFQLCGAMIGITTDSVNEVGETHTFIVHVTQSVAGVVSPAVGVHPTVTLVASAGAVATNVVDNCATVGTDANGDCTVTFTSNHTGAITGHAEATVTTGTSTFDVATGGEGALTGDAVERFVNAKIALSPLTAVNPLDAPHTITANVQQDDSFDAGAPGDGATGFGPAPDGTTVTFTLVNNTAGAAFVNGVDSCTTTGGTCSVVINSSTPGAVETHATTTFDVGGVSLTRASGTGAPNSADAHKTYQATFVPAPHISIAKTPDTQTIVSGATASFGIEVTNDGNVALSDVHVTDALASGCDHVVGSLAVGAHASYECTKGNVTASFTNTAVATGTPPAGEAVTASDTADVTVVAPHISVAKTPDTQVVLSGGTATFTIEVTNDGDTALSNVHVTDALASDCDHTVGALAVGAHASYQCSNADVTGDFTNTAVATGTPAVGDDVTASDTADVTVVHPHISVAKTPDTQTVVAGSTVTFTIEVTNDGDTALSNVHVTDALAADCDRAVGALAAGAPASPHSSHDNSAADFTNTAVATGTPAVGDDVTASDTADVAVVHPHISVAKTPDTQTVVAGSTVTFTIKVTNDGDSALSNVNVADALAGDCDHAIGALAAGAHVSYECTKANVTASFTNTAVATGTPPVGDDVTATDTADVTVVHPHISVAKTPDAQTVVSGGTATFTIKVTNDGDSALSNVNVADALAGDCDHAIGALAAGAHVSYECTKANVTASFTNTAVATGTPPVGDDVTATDTADVTVVHPHISVAKTPDAQTVVSGGTATFTIVVTNDGDTPLGNVQVTDAIAPDCNQAIGPLVVGEQASYHCTKDDVTADFTNTAVATGTPPVGPNVTASDTAHVTVTTPEAPPIPPTPPIQPTPPAVVTHPGISISKDPGTQSIAQGGTAAFSITVTNTGDVALMNVNVSDPLSTNCSRPIGMLASGA